MLRALALKKTGRLDQAHIKALIAVLPLFYWIHHTDPPFQRCSSSRNSHTMALPIPDHRELEARQREEMLWLWASQLRADNESLRRQLSLRDAPFRIGSPDAFTITHLLLALGLVTDIWIDVLLRR